MNMKKNKIINQRLWKKELNVMYLFLFIIRAIKWKIKLIFRSLEYFNALTYRFLLAVFNF